MRGWWAGGWLAWLVLCCMLVVIVRADWPDSPLANSLPVLLAALGSSVIGYLRRRHSPARGSGVATIARALVIGVTLSTLIMAVPLLHAFVA